jgi:single-strand DNA-binding protein
MILGYFYPKLKNIRKQLITAEIQTTVKVYYTNNPFFVFHICVIIFLTPKTKKNMSSMRNSVRLIGNIGNEPEIKKLDGEKKLAKFSLATNETYKNDKGEKITETQWHNLIAWGATAGVIEKYTKKGQEIAVEGKLTSKSYTDKEGIKRYVTEIVVSDVLLLAKS